MRRGNPAEDRRPAPENVEIRDLLRYRDDARVATRKTKQQLLSFLLKHGLRYSGKNNWSKVHCNWLSDLKMAHPAQQIALQEYITSVEDANQRVFRITPEISML